MTNKKESAIPSYESTRVVLCKSGELLLALPVYANETGSFLTEIDIQDITGIPNMSIGIYDHIGYVMFSPVVGEFVMGRKALELFEDLGKL